MGSEYLHLVKKLVSLRRAFWFTEILISCFMTMMKVQFWLKSKIST